MITPLIQSDATITPATVTGPATLEGQCGRVNIATAASSITVNNALVNINTLVFCQLLSNDSTASIKNVVCSAGSFTVNLSAAATAETKMGFYIP